MPLYRSRSHDPWENLAAEEYLLDHVAAPSLYLWRNDDTVVIGRHQNAWAECDIRALEDGGGRLARRLSGGGAVYHDLRNLNFTFLMPREMYDRERQTAVILRAVQSLGIRAEATGRNDLLACGRKFSGHAFCFRERSAYHHGTILLDTDVERMMRVLTVDASKLSSKAVASVRARVVNLRELRQDLDVELMAEALTKAFRGEYGETGDVTDTGELPRGEIAPLREKYASWDWRFGETPRFDVRIAGRFDWGTVDLRLELRDARVANAVLYTDALDTELGERLRSCITGVPYDAQSITGALAHEGREMSALGELIARSM